MDEFDIFMTEHSSIKETQIRNEQSNSNTHNALIREGRFQAIELHFLFFQIQQKTDYNADYSRDKIDYRLYANLLLQTLELFSATH